MNAELLRDSLSFIETRMPAAFLRVYRFATLAAFGTAVVQGAGVEPARFVDSISV
jgi:hypothetical protein